MTFYASLADVDSLVARLRTPATTTATAFDAGIDSAYMTFYNRFVRCFTQPEPEHLLPRKAGCQPQAFNERGHFENTFRQIAKVRAIPRQRALQVEFGYDASRLEQVAHLPGGSTSGTSADRTADLAVLNLYIDEIEAAVLQGALEGIPLQDPIEACLLEVLEDQRAGDRVDLMESLSERLKQVHPVLFTGPDKKRKALERSLHRVQGRLQRMLAHLGPAAVAEGPLS